jgi:hypothetical protein
MPDAPRNRAVWIVRLVFYPAAILLIVLALHERSAHADGDDAVAFRPTAPWRFADATFDGILDQVDGRVEPIRLWFRPHAGVLRIETVTVTFGCTPDVGPIWAVYDQVGGTLPLHARVDTEWPTGWKGVTDLRVDARGDVHTIVGTLRATVAIARGPQHAVCQTGPLPFSLTATPAYPATTSPSIRRSIAPSTS